MSTLIARLKHQLFEKICYLPLSDRQFNELMYRHYIGRPLHLNPPVTFNEKIQWLKLYGDIATYGPLVDKYEVREYVLARVGADYLNELYGIFDHEDQIDFEILPQSFVLKATHGSGWNILCKDKSQLNVEATRLKLRKWRLTNFYRFGREPNYRNIHPRIICERFLEGDDQRGLLDYKLFCFHGRVKIIQVDFDRYITHTRNMYDIDWNLCDFTFIYPNNPVELPRPDNLAKMIDVAEALAVKIPFVRVDLYDIASKIVFGELTFTPESGLGIFRPHVWDSKLGGYLHLPGGTRQSRQ